MNAQKTLKRLLRDTDPASWLVAADLMEESGQEGAEGLRAKARLTGAIIGAVLARHAKNGGRLVGSPKLIGDNLYVGIGGGRLVMDVCLWTKEERQREDATGERQWRWVQVSFAVKLRRDLLFTRPGYLDRRAAELADDYLSDEQHKGVPSVRDAQAAASVLGDAVTDSIVGPGGLSGASAPALRRLVAEARREMLPRR